MVLESITVALKEEGIEEIPAMGETFDPNLHQAVQTVPLLKKPQQIPLLKFYKKGTNYKIVCYDHQWSLLHNNKR